MALPAQKSRLWRHRQLSPTASIRVSPLCLGSMNFGEASKKYMGECDKDTAFAILDHFVSQGGNFIDTSNAYQEGQAEQWLGEWMLSRQNRDEMVLATKYSSAWKAHERDRIQSNYGGNGTKSMRLSLDDSLRKLQTTYVDLFYVHWWDYTTTIPELMHALNDLVSSGKVMYLGVSDSPAWVVSKANQYARDHGLRQFVVYQGMWNAATRDFERDIIPMCRDEGMGLCPYASVGGGLFQTELGYRERERSNPGRKLLPLQDSIKDVARVLETVADSKGVGLFAVALMYVFHKAPYVTPIVGGRKVEHIKDNIAALEVRLSDEDIRTIDAAMDFQHGFPTTFLSGTLAQGGRSRPAWGPSDIWLTKRLGDFDWVDPPKPIEVVQRGSS